MDPGFMAGSGYPPRSKRRPPPPALPAPPLHDGIVARIRHAVRLSLNSPKTRRAALDAARLSNKIMKRAGRAAWIAGTTFLVLVVPLIIEMDREAQLIELEGQQANLMGAPSQPLGFPHGLK